jgi:hypothetical protein
MGRSRLPARELDEAERSELKALVLRRKTGQALALRARIVLACEHGVENQRVAAQLKIDKDTVGKWRRRFVASNGGAWRCTSFRSTAHDRGCARRSDHRQDA